MFSYLGTVNDFHWGFKPVLSYSKPYTFSTFLEKKKKEKVHLISQFIPKYNYIFLNVCYITLFKSVCKQEPSKIANKQCIRVQRNILYWLIYVNFCDVYDTMIILLPNLCSPNVNTL